MHYRKIFEDFNHAAGGGLYAELIRNRSFEAAATLDSWIEFNQTGAMATANYTVDVHDGNRFVSNKLIKE